MDPYPHIKAKYPGEPGDMARAVPTLSDDDTYRLMNDLHWLLGEVERLRAVEAAARAVSDGVDSAETAEANLLRALDAAIDRLDAARA